MPFAIVVGNPFDGLTIYGPVDDGSEATELAEKNFSGSTWVVVEIHDPNEGQE